MNPLPLIMPVIHYRNETHMRDQIDNAFDWGADGVFLISHIGHDMRLIELAEEAKRNYPRRAVGLNLLAFDAEYAAELTKPTAVDMLWVDNAGISSAAVDVVQVGRLKQALGHKDLFVGVAFKYQPPEPNPALAALNALRHGFIPTTSGPETGMPPSLEKIIRMSEVTNGRLAVASGMTPENVANYAPYLSHILVSTGICDQQDRIVEEKLKALIANAQGRGP